MAARREGEALAWLDALGREGAAGGLGDGELLARFRAGPGRAAEAAFEAIVRRHGPTVLARCRAILRDEHAADDAFQATFLVLARRAATVRDADRLGPWLGRVARRVALRSRRTMAAERARAGRLDLAVVPGPAAAASGALVAEEAASAVRIAVDRLPAEDRRLMHLTYWRGMTYEEAAAATGRPVGTVRSRLSRARDRLRGRLARLGPGAMLGPGRVEAVPGSGLVLRTVRGAMGSSSKAAAGGAGAVPAAVAALAEGELAMVVMSWKAAAALLVVGGMAGGGAATLAGRVVPAGPPAPAPVAADAASLLSNGGVEEGTGDAPTGWTRGHDVPGVSLSWSRDVAHGGKSSLALKKTARRYWPTTEWTQKVERRGDLPRLRVVAWVKAEAAGKVVLDVQFLDAKGERSHAWASYIGARAANDPPVTHDWKRYEGVVAIPPGTKQILVGPQIYGPGTVWVDDLAAEFTDAPAVDPTAP